MENKKIEKLEEIKYNEWIEYATLEEVKHYLYLAFKKINELIEVKEDGE